MDRGAEGQGKATTLLGQVPGWILGTLLAALALRAGDGKPLAAQRAKAAAAHSDCRLCHRTHRSLEQATLRGNRQGPIASPLDEVCLGCHQGPPTPAKDQGASKLTSWSGSGSSHVDGPFLARARTFARSVDKGDGRRVTLRPRCDACHDVHPRNQGPSLSALAFDSLGKALRGRPATVSQTCFGCHAGPEAVRFLQSDGDVGARVGPSSQSGHRPGATGKGRQDLPSLRGGLFPGTLDCTSCHDDPTPGAPRGPHASPYSKLLRAPYAREADFGITGARVHDLCYGCHERASIEGNQSFPLHAQHLNGFTGLVPRRENALPSARRAGPMAWKPTGFGAFGGGVARPTSCGTCHDPHGSSRNPASVAFDPSVVTKSSVGTIAFQRTGFRQGNCTLTCHGHDHIQTPY